MFQSNSHYINSKKQLLDAIHFFLWSRNLQQPIFPRFFFHLPMLQQMDAAHDGHHGHEAGQRQQQPGAIGRPLQRCLRQQRGEAAEEAEANVVAWLVERQGSPNETSRLHMGFISICNIIYVILYM